MLQRIIGPIPNWATREHPMLRYELQKVEPATRRARFTRAFGLIITSLILGVTGWAVATDLFREPPGQHPTEQIMNIVYFPLVVIQVLISVLVIAYTVGMVSGERQRQTWDNMRATSFGTELSMRVRWVSVFYRMRALLTITMGMRIVLIIGVLFDLTAFGGRYLDLLVGGTTPDLPVYLSALLVSLMLTAILLLPLTSIGFDAAIGLLVSILLPQRIYNLLIQIFLTLLRIALVVGFVFLAFDIFQPSGALNPNPILTWLSLYGFAAIGDWGLYYLQLGYAAEAWAIAPYGIFIGPAMLVFALLQAYFADLILSVAIRIADRKS